MREQSGKISALTRPTAHLISAMQLGTPVSRVLRPRNINIFRIQKRRSQPAKPRQTRVIMAKTKFRPLHDRVVVKRVEAEDKSKGGIIIPDTAKEKPQEGQVVAVGPGGRDENGKLIPMGVKAGDRVLFGKWSGTEVKLDGDELLIMKESDIMGVVA
jgi:chaperonin GroES